MTALFRFLKITYLFFSYRLNEIFPKEALPKWLFFLFLLSPFRFSKKKKSSGERLAEALEKAGPVFIKFGQSLGFKGVIAPVLSAWMGNIVFLLLAFTLFYNCLLYTSPSQRDRG